MMIRTPLRVLAFTIFTLLPFSLGVASLYAQSQVDSTDNAPSTVHGWPRTFTNDGTAFTVYQPQAISWNGNTLTFREAVSVLPQGDAQSSFGTVTLSGATSVDQEAQTVSLSGVNVVQSTFPSAPDLAADYASQFAAQAALWGQAISLQAVKANLAVTAAESSSAKPVQVQNTPPTIYFSESPALLVLVDGSPALRSIPGSSLLRVINTQALIALDQSTGTYYLRVNGAWAQAQAMTGPWTAAANPPDALAALLQQATANGNAQLFDPPQGQTPPPMPVIYVSTTPAELVTTQGPPNFEPVSGTQLLHASNTGSSLFMNVANQTYYLVISGRWFSTASLTGSWQFVPANQLPPDFANIPESDPAGNVLASVAGTPQAAEATISATIPQTATISRSAATNVTYAGDPQFQKIPGTSLSYAPNTATPVIRVANNKYYAVVNGIWFKASSPSGPWHVATSVPSVIYTIPPSCPIYYATSVYVYNATPEVVSVGYTPGYFGTCLAPEGVVVYGTGYTYIPYISGNVWIGPPLTYGFGAGFSCGLATGFAFGLAADHGWGCSPWWGPWHGGWGSWNGGGWNHSNYNNASWNRNSGNSYTKNVTNNWNNVNVNRQNVYNRWGNNVVKNNNVSQNQITRNTSASAYNQASSAKSEYNSHNDNDNHLNDVTRNNYNQEQSDYRANHPNHNAENTDNSDNANNDKNQYNQEKSSYEANHPNHEAKNDYDNAKSQRQENPDNNSRGVGNDASTYKANHPDTGENHSTTDRKSLSKDSSHLGNNDVFAGNDGKAYRSKSDGGWQQRDGSGWKDVGGAGMKPATQSDLNNQRYARNVGNLRSGGGSGGGGSYGGGEDRRRN